MGPAHLDRRVTIHADAANCDLTMMRWGVVACCLWFTAATPSPRVSILSAPGVARDGQATIQIHVPRHPDNERLVVALIEGDLLWRRSEQPLYRVNRTIFTYEWWNLSECSCQLLAVLYDTREEVGRDSQTMLVRR